MKIFVGIEVATANTKKIYITKETISILFLEQYKTYKGYRDEIYFCYMAK